MVVLLVLGLVLAFAANPLDATPQEPEGRSWEVEAELGGTLFYGNRNQSLITTRTEVAHRNPTAESTLELRFSYGEATDDEGVSEVNRRSWLVDSAVNFRPGGRWRPFFTVRGEAALERRIDGRYHAGTGIKYDNRIDRDNRTEFSLAILGERIYRRTTAGSTEEEQGNLARLSSELRIRRTLFGERLAIDLQNAYRPVFDALGNYVIDSRNAFTITLTEMVGLRFAIQTEFDSGAKDRGADKNNDGELHLAIVVSF